MNAITAAPEAGTQRTKNTGTAEPAGYSIHQRIDSFVKKNLAAAGSDDFSSVKASASRAAAHGFTSSSNSRYAAWLEAFRSTPALAAKYAERYPASCFLPWAAFHAVKKAMGLWCELPEFYAGSVPDEQLPWLDIFELGVTDLPRRWELTDLVGSKSDPLGHMWMGAVERLGIQDFNRYGDNTIWFEKDLTDGSDGKYGISLNEEQLRALGRPRFHQPLIDAWNAVKQSFFVMAPPEAFTTDKDWIVRLRDLTAAVPEVKVVPDDPLVIRFCHGGALVVAAWGDEGAELNKITRELGI